MNASEAKQMVIEGKSKTNNNEEIVWNMLKTVIFAEVEEAAKKGQTKIDLDLNSPKMAGANNIMKKIETELESEGFKVNFLLTRTPNGARSLIVEW